MRFCCHVSMFVLLKELFSCRIFVCLVNLRVLVERGFVSIDRLFFDAFSRCNSCDDATRLGEVGCDCFFLIDVVNCRKILKVLCCVCFDSCSVCWLMIELKGLWKKVVVDASYCFFCLNLPCVMFALMSCSEFAWYRGGLNRRMQSLLCANVPSSVFLQGVRFWRRSVSVTAVVSCVNSVRDVPQSQCVYVPVLTFVSAFTLLFCNGCVRCGTLHLLSPHQWSLILCQQFVFLSVVFLTFRDGFLVRLVSSCETRHDRLLQGLRNANTNLRCSRSDDLLYRIQTPRYLGQCSNTFLIFMHNLQFKSFGFWHSLIFVSFVIECKNLNCCYGWVCSCGYSSACWGCSYGYSSACWGYSCVTAPLRIYLQSLLITVLRFSISIRFYLSVVTSICSVITWNSHPAMVMEEPLPFICWRIPAVPWIEILRKLRLLVSVFHLYLLIFTTISCRVGTVAKLCKDFIQRDVTCRSTLLTTPAKYSRSRNKLPWSCAWRSRDVRNDA